jgi:D-3-phosphoglycerate dehydrogenase
MSGTKTNILVIDDLHSCFFEQAGMEKFNITYFPEIVAKDVSVALVNQDVLVVRSKVFVNEALCKKANSLKLICRAGSGVDNLDIQWLEKQGIAYINTPEANGQAVAEQTLGMLLSLMTNITKADREVHNMLWDREGNRGDELDGKTIGIIGFGNTGSRFARLMSGFNTEVLVYDKYKSGFSTAYAKESRMEELFERSDILSLHIPLTSETHHLVNSGFIQRFAKPFRLLNLSRGSIVDTEAVIDAIESKKIIGFAADVLENERITQLNNLESIAFAKLRSFSNVVLTPHIGGWTHQSYKKISESLALKISAFFVNFAPQEKGFKEAQKFP